MIIEVAYLFIISHIIFFSWDGDGRQNGGSPSTTILDNQSQKWDDVTAWTGAMSGLRPLTQKRSSFFSGGRRAAPALRSPVAWAPERRPNGVAQFSCWPVDLLSKHWAQLVAYIAFLYSTRFFSNGGRAAWLDSFPTCTSLPHVSVISVLRPTASLKPVLHN